MGSSECTLKRYRVLNYVPYQLYPRRARSWIVNYGSTIVEAPGRLLIGS